MSDAKCEHMETFLDGKTKLKDIVTDRTPVVTYLLRRYITVSITLSIPASVKYLEYKIV